MVDPLSEFYFSRVIDSDMAKEELPEFHGGIGANAVHRESQDVIQDVLVETIKNGDNMVWPIVGGGNVDNLMGKIQMLKDNGYSVYLHLNELPNGKAIGRSLNRCVEKGRFIPPQIIAQYGDTPTQNFNTIINTEGLVDGYSHYSNDVERGQSPRLIEISENVREFDERRQRGIQRGTEKETQSSGVESLNSTNTQADSNSEPASFMPENGAQGGFGGEVQTDTAKGESRPLTQQERNLQAMLGVVTGASAQNSQLQSSANNSLPNNENGVIINNIENEKRFTDRQHKAAIMRYKSGEAYTINAMLREGEGLDEVSQEFVDTLDEALQDLPKYEGTVYRNVTFDDFGGEEAYNNFLSEYIPNKLIIYDQFISCSTKQDGYPVEGEYKVQLVVEGKNARNVDGYGNNMESEVIYPLNSVFIVDKINLDSEYPIIYLQEAMTSGYQSYEEQSNAMRNMQELYIEDGDLQSVPTGDTVGDTIGSVRPQSTASKRQGDTLRAGGRQGAVLSTESAKQENRQIGNTKADSNNEPASFMPENESGYFDDDTDESGNVLYDENTEAESGFALTEFDIREEKVDWVQQFGDEVAGYDRKTEGQRLLFKAAQKLGWKIGFANVYKRDKNGKVIRDQDGKPQKANARVNKAKKEIVFDYDCESPVSELIKHELTHFLETNVAAYQDFANAVMNSKTFKNWVRVKGYENTAAYNEAIRKTYKGVSGFENEADAENSANLEMVAEFVAEKLFKNEQKMLDRLVQELTPAHRSKLGELINRLLTKLKNAFSGMPQEKEIRQLENKWIETYKKAETAWQEKQGLEQQKNTADNSGMQYSLNIKHTDGSIEKLSDARDLNDEQAISYLEKAKRGELQGHTYIPVRKDTPQVVIDSLGNIGRSVNNLSMIMQVRKAQQAMSLQNNGAKQQHGKNVRKHALTPKEIVEVINNLDNPTTIILQTNRHNQYGEELPNNIAIFVEYSNNGKEGVAVIEFESSIDPQFIGNEYGETEYHTVVTVFEPDTERHGMSFDYVEELLSNPDNYEVEIVRRQPERSATREKHPNTSNELPSNNSILNEEPSVNNKSMQNNDEYSLPVLERAEEQGDYNVETAFNTDNLFDRYDRGEISRAELMEGISSQKREFDGIDNYTEEQYNNFGWARYNEILDAKDIKYITGEIQKIINGNSRGYVMTQYGDYIIPLGGKYNVLVYTDDNVDSPHIRKVLEIDSNDQVLLDSIRRDILNANSEKLQMADDYVRRIYGEKYFVEYKRQNFLSFRGYTRAEQERVAGRTSGNISETRIDGRNALQQNSRSNRAGLKESAFSMPKNSNEQYSLTVLEKTEKADNNLDFSLQINELNGRLQRGEITQDEFLESVKELSDDNIDTQQKNKSKETPKTISDLTEADADTTPPLKRRTGKAVGNRQSKTYESLLNSDIFDDTFKNEVQSDDFIRKYQAIGNEKTMREAAQELDEGGRKYVNQWWSLEPQRASLIDTAVGFILIDRYQRIGDYDSAVAVAEKVREFGTASGQQVQIFSILGRLDPNTMAIYAQKELTKAFETMIEGRTQRWINKNAERFKLTAELALVTTSAKTVHRTVFSRSAPSLFDSHPYK